MPERRPLVIDGTGVAELPVGDTLPGAVVASWTDGGLVSGINGPHIVIDSGTATNPRSGAQRTDFGRVT